MILTPSRAVRVFAFPEPADLRNGYNGLFGLVQNVLKADPMSGDLFLFVNESRKLCKSPERRVRWIGLSKTLAVAHQDAMFQHFRLELSASSSPASSRECRPGAPCT